MMYCIEYVARNIFSNDPFMKPEVVFLFQNNATSCEESCAFLAQLQNFSSILAGDGSLPPKPSMPTVTSKNFTSISLKWDPVQNTNGTAVYLIEITFTGEQSRFSPSYLSEVNCSDIIFISPSLLSLFGLAVRHVKDILFLTIF